MCWFEIRVAVRRARGVGVVADAGRDDGDGVLAALGWSDCDGDGLERWGWVVGGWEGGGCAGIVC